MPDLSLVIQERADQAAQLILLCHAAGADAASLLPLGARLSETFPQATIVSLQAATAADAPQGFDWFPMADVTDQNRPLRVAQALPALQAAVRGWQERSGVSAAATALIGLSQGAEMVLELSKLQPMLASRVVAIGGRFTTLPDVPVAVTTIHLLHGKQDELIPYSHSVTAAHHLLDMGCDITAEVVPFVGHELHPDLIALAITKLSTHIARHLWTAAQEAAPNDQGTNTSG
ncbi:MAG: esterase [Rhodoferax sp.]|uniref:esterase n=1 Tax=Rhodoferax sp. TaxID=50421 RepID=UPI0013FF8EBC|nr:esterase [Rhodoferax sp.]NDP38284.1 esterase [Rhodoferax sp.]